MKSKGKSRKIRKNILQKILIINESEKSLKNNSTNRVPLRPPAPQNSRRYIPPGVFLVAGVIKVIE